MLRFRRLLFPALLFCSLCLAGCAVHDDGDRPDIKVSGSIENSFGWQK